MPVAVCTLVGMGDTIAVDSITRVEVGVGVFVERTCGAVPDGG